MIAKFLKPTLKTLLLLLLSLCLSQGAMGQSVNARSQRIVGVYDVEVSLTNCATGAQIAQFKALHKYELGGTAQIVPSTTPTALSAHVGVWTYDSDNNYRLTFKMFRFDAAGNNIGYFILKNDVSISEDGTNYAGSGKAELFDNSGNLLGTSCPVFKGSRLQP